MQVGFIGLGAMGFPMAKRLVEAGFPLHVMVHRQKGPALELEALGAFIHGQVHEVAAASDVIITILPADPEMDKVLLDKQFLESLKPGAIVLEMTSGSPGAIKKIDLELSSKGVRVIDAPVSGGTAGARNGKLTIMAGGDEAALLEVKPLLDVMASKVIHVGGIGAGKAVKAINQMLAAVHMVAASEAIALGEKLGIDMDALHAVVKESSGGSFIFDNKFSIIRDEQFAPGFRMNLMKKDMGIALSEAEGIPMPIASAAYQMYHAASRLDGDADYAAVSRMIRG